ncbi:MAG: ATP-binding protein [Mogibacterium sp.]|nr:ATP-binding protein [Mogibacterium sp.]
METNKPEYVNRIIKPGDSSLQITRKLMFRLLPVQFTLAAVGAVNGLVSSYFASNYVGIDAMSAIGLYSPVNLLINAIAVMLAGGCSIICGKYLGQNQFGKIQNIFTMDLMVTTAIGATLTVAVAVIGAFNLTAMFTADPAIRQSFNIYLIGKAIGIVPAMLGTQLASFLSIESMGKRTMRASIVFIVVNLVLNLLFVQVMRMEAFGLALASSLGMWAFFSVELQYFLSKKSHLNVFGGTADLHEGLGIIAVGFPGAASLLYLTLRGLILNELLDHYIGSAGLSAFATASSLLDGVWALQAGMLAVSRLLISISVGEEDRQALINILRAMKRYFIPLIIAVDILVILLAVPLTYIFYRDPSQEVFDLTVMSIRILPLSMPLAVFNTHFSCYFQASGRQGYVNVLAILDGVVFVSAFAALLIGPMGYAGVPAASVIGGILNMLYVIGYAWIRNGKLSFRTEDLMVIPEGFGVTEDDRLDITIRTSEEAVEVSQKVQEFCESKGVDARRSYYAALAMEEMVCNIVDHGFCKDDKDHTVDVRVVYKGGKVLLRIKDDCVPFNPKERASVFSPDDAGKNIGIRMIYKMMEDIEYQYMLGLNVLTIRL